MDVFCSLCRCQRSAYPASPYGFHRVESSLSSHHVCVLEDLSSLLSLSETGRITSNVLRLDVVLLTLASSSCIRPTCRTGYVFPGPFSTFHALSALSRSSSDLSCRPQGVPTSALTRIS